MRTNLECRARDLRDFETDGLPGGERLARLIGAGLPAHGFTVEAVQPEDWGWRVQLVNDAFPLWIGCGHYDEWPEDGLLCFIEPSRPHVRRWLRRIATAPQVVALAEAVEQILRESGARDLRWWTAEESARG